MGKVEDYINALDGQDNIDVTEVVSNLLKLHNEEVDTREAKIASLSDENEKHISDISARDDEITKWKAKNWDLVNQLPGENKETESSEIDEKTGLPPAHSITLDDLFEN